MRRRQYLATGFGLVVTAVCPVRATIGAGHRLPPDALAIFQEFDENGEADDELEVGPDRFEAILSESLAETSGGEVVAYDEGDEWGVLTVISGAHGDEDVLNREIAFIAGMYAGYVTRSEAPPSEGLDVELQTEQGEPVGWFVVETTLAERFGTDRLSESEFVSAVLSTLEPDKWTVSLQAGH